MSEVSVKISSDTSSLTAGLQKAKESVNEFKESASDKFNEAGGDLTKAFAAGAVIEGLKSVGEEMERIQKLSIRFGESAETMQRVGAAARGNGTDLETVAKAMQKVTVNGVEALKGNEKLSDAFDTLGINTKDFVDLPLDEKLARLAESYDSSSSNAEKMDAVQRLLGKSGAELIPMFAQGAEALRDQFASASVASNAAVQSIAEANERLEASFTTLKTWGAEALGWIAEKAKGLGYGLAAITAYVENLPRGFKAAKEAAEDAMQAAADMEVEDDQRHEREMERARQGGTADHTKEIQDAAKKEDELQKLRDENYQKEEAAHLRKISLVNREHELLMGIVQAEKDVADATASGDEKARLMAENRRLDLLKELDENGQKQKKEQEKASEEVKHKKEKDAKALSRLTIDLKREELEEAEKNFSKLEKKSRSSFSVDNLRAVGGGIANVNYRGIGAKENMQREALQLAKEQVEQLKSVVKALDDKQKYLDFSGDGSYTAS